MGTKNSETIVFTKEFTRQEAIPEEGIKRAVELMRSGRIHRYNTTAGEESEAALLEKEFAAYVGTKYCLSCASCGSSIYLALKSAGVKPGDKVLCNAYTLAPVPGAIENAGGKTVLVEIKEDYTIDLDDLDQKAGTSGAGYLLLSHMRGHITNMDRIVEICDRHGLVLIEDCAHTMGARWDNRPSGTFGKIGCYSTQTYKHMNSGEGGLLVTSDDAVIAQAILFSGSYMLYERHLSRPETAVFEKYKKITPNFSMRMDNLRAAMLRPQLRDIETQCRRRIKAVIEGTGESPVPCMSEMARNLVAWGADFLVIPCNTAHYYFDAVQASVNVPVLNMIDLTVAAITMENPEVRRPGLLASTAVLMTGLYKKRFIAKGLEMIAPADPVQAKVMTAIRQIKTGQFGRREIEAVNDAAKEMTAAGADVLIVACTELSIISASLKSSLRLYDTSQVLAEAVVKEARKNV